MKNLIIFLSTLICITHQLAMSSNNNNHDDEGYGPEIYIDTPLDNEEYEKTLVNRLPLEEPLTIRMKRSIAKYKILESPGLHSHFKNKMQIQDEDELKSNPQRRRYRRSLTKRSELHSDEVEDVDGNASKAGEEGGDFSIESVPQAQKQTMNPAYYKSDNSRLMDDYHRVKAPYGNEYQSRSHKEQEEDSQSDSSSNVGVKSRTPRVNFITQQGQTNNKDEPDGPEARERERERERERDRDRDRDQQSGSGNNKQNSNTNANNHNNNNDDGYRKPPSDDRYYPSNYNNKNYDPYERPVPNNYYYNNYSPYYREQPNYYGNKYEPYYDRYFDRYYDRYNGIAPPAGLSRMVPPNGLSSSFYYRHQYNDYDDYLPRTIPNQYYADKRFPTPMEPREMYDSYRPYLNNNDVNGNRPGRIVYYANLPEVVRTPGNYRAATARYGENPMYNNDYYYNVRDDYQRDRVAKSAYYDVPVSTTMRIASTPVRSSSLRDRAF